MGEGYKKEERNSVLSYRRCSSLVKFSMRNLPASGFGNEEAADERVGRCFGGRPDAQNIKEMHIAGDFE
jgi:hypothetical protein